MDDDWSDEDVVEETKENFEPHDTENHVEETSTHLALHLLESAVIGQVVEKPEETVIVSKNERFADVTYDRRDTRSPDDNIHGQRQIYNPKLGKFENVEAQPGRDQDRHNRRNIEIMQRGLGRRASTSSRRRDSLVKGDELRQSRGLHVDNRGYSPSVQRRTSLAERDPTGFPQRRRDSFISASAVSDADRSMSNASPGFDSQSTADQGPTVVVDLLALQKTEMAESCKRALERRAKDEEERLAAAERAKKKAAELAAMASGDGKSETSTASPIPTTLSPHVSKASPVSQNLSPVLPKSSLSSRTTSSKRCARHGKCTSPLPAARMARSWRRTTTSASWTRRMA